MTQLSSNARNVRPCRRRHRLLQRAKEELEVSARLILRPALTVLLLRRAEDPFRVLADLVERGIGTDVSSPEELGKFSFDGPKLSEHSREYLARHRLLEELEALLRETVTSSTEDVRKHLVTRLRELDEQHRSSPQQHSVETPPPPQLPKRRNPLTGVRGALSVGCFADALKKKRKNLRRIESFPAKKPKIEVNLETTEERHARMKNLLKLARQWFGSVRDACKENLPHLFPNFQVKLHKRLGQGRFADVFRATCVYPLRSGQLEGESVALKRFRFVGSALPVSAVGEIQKEIQASYVIFGSENASEDDTDRFIRLLAIVRDDESQANVIGPPLSPRSQLREAAAMKAELCRAEQSSAILGLDAGEDCPRSLGLLYEWGTEGDLHQRLHSGARKGLTSVERFQIIGQVALGLRFLHGQGYAHADIKSHNVILFREDDDRIRAKIGDLGSVMAVPSADAHEGLGTLGWTAPEALAHVTRITTSAIDIFSLGVMAWDCATAPRRMEESLDPFVSVGPKDYVDAVEKGVRPSFRADQQPEIAKLQSIAEACWATSPDERPSADGLLRKYFC
uniref:Protein kinase domain-containing protein n=1 Tax=Pinguiococcus pyrenoidosus TaxID=172671 RepID=A0A7R9U887_9STRA|mmetsp:Transcript_18741/g.70902  ORF Transcript_18741/g.70902 Transcript_18741/m.70902 type:complete len:568 (+) Transcript_18741:264-1967(+)